MLRDREIVLPSIARAASGVILRSLHIRFGSNSEILVVSKLLPSYPDSGHGRRIRGVPAGHQRRC
jgi:hypothetical protein